MKSTISFGFFYPIPKPQIHTTSLLIILSSPIWMSYVILPLATISILQCCRPKVTGSFVSGRQQCRSPFPPSHQVKESKIVRDLIDFGPCGRFLLLITLLITAYILFCTTNTDPQMPSKTYMSLGLFCTGSDTGKYN